MKETSNSQMVANVKLQQVKAEGAGRTTTKSLWNFCLLTGNRWPGTAAADPAHCSGVHGLEAWTSY